jgi:ribosomal protein S13
MARIAGVNLPLNKRIEIGLTYVHGVGRSTANEVLSKIGIDPDTYVKDLTEARQHPLPPTTAGTGVLPRSRVGSRQPRAWTSRA